MVSTTLKKLLEKTGKTQREVADDLGLNRQRFNFYVTGKREPDNEMLQVLADYFNVTVDYLLGKTQKNKPVTPEEDELAKLLEDPETREFYELIKDFSDDELEDLLNYGQYLIAKRDSKKKP